ncbi:glycosyltransferase [Alkalicoccobacillus gibsonii]|uniref:Glycosyltransferase n=1 Tax=Alkalicoccobacillus gibsonii TaxID=79881 RepID=A0ABU9VLT8_9BACI
MKGKVCFLVSEHPFLDARIFYKEAKSLVRNGFCVTLIVPRKQGYLFEPSGNLLEDTFLESTFQYEGVRFVTYEQELSSKPIAHQLHYLQTGQVDPFPSKLRELGVRECADIYHAHEQSSCYEAIMIKRQLKDKEKRCRIIYDSHELDLDPRDRSISRLRQQQLKLLLREMYQTVDAVITVSPKIESEIQRLCSNVRTLVLYNAPLLSTWQERETTDAPLVLGYVGAMHHEKGSMDKLYEIHRLTSKWNLHIKVIGGPPDQTDSERMSWSGWVPFEELPSMLDTVDVGWIDVDVQNSLNREYSLPNKLFSYLERGIPPIVNQCVQMEQFLKVHECGFVINEKEASAAEYAALLQKLNEDRSTLQRVGRNGRRIIEEQYSWDHMERHLVSLYHSLLA